MGTTARMISRVEPVSIDEPMVERFFRFQNAQAPYVERIDENTIYIRLRTFDNFHYNEMIANLINTNFAELSNTQNLIMDIRGNDGGDVMAVAPDFLIDSTVPAYRWVEHVTELMNSWVTEPEPRRRRGRR